MLIEIPKNYKPTKGRTDDPIRYLTKKEGNSFPQWVNFPHKYPLLDHCETFIDRTTKEKIFVSHNFRGWGSKIKVPIGGASGEVLCPGLQMATFLLYPLMGESL